MTIDYRLSMDRLEDRVLFTLSCYQDLAFSMPTKSQQSRVKDSTTVPMTVRENGSLTPEMACSSCGLYL